MTSKYWVHWLSIAITCGFFTTVDLLFLNDGAIVFDPFMSVQKAELCLTGPSQG